MPSLPAMWPRTVRPPEDSPPITASVSAILAVVDDVDLAAGGVQDRLQAGLGDAEHRVEHDVEVPVWAMSSLVTSASASRPPSVKTLIPL